ncbi:AAA family ATPase [Paenalkalicoccus suaedae]|uniref:Nuclease SbcCD subunit C n=1 Tax=Paenalkalicoccus suaedae TaxID=2592382 RepID=A0A859FEG4_9BACI|nr:AAA family ATPase [Paenalkalicoccus suaedae]QKS71689.1 AAA family ATPase [Paenalkalicoccus suaedae]QKS71743.1 AAA family ATPase [Paenalkalicoccus suaedae]
MKKIKLITMKLRNFKGIKLFELHADGDNARIFGDNATGKTTLFDAAMWLLLDKDANNRADFQIKTVDADGNVIHGLEHEVLASFTVDNKPLTLQKIYKEKWTKKRGAATSEFTGHTTDYLVNEVPVKKGDYQSKVAELIDEETFKLLTNPAYFNEHLKREQRRDILLEVCGDVSNEDVLNSNDKLKKLSGRLAEHTIDEIKAIVKSKKKKINDELEAIPVRIDEIDRTLPDIAGLKREKIKDDIDVVDAKIEALDDEVTQVRNGNAIASYQNEITELKGQLTNLKYEHGDKERAATSDLKKELNDKKDRLSDLQAQHSRLVREMESLGNDRNWSNQELQKLRNKFSEINSQEYKEEFHHTGEDTCPTCAQALPADQVKEAHEKAKEDYNKRKQAFNASKSQQLEDINARGKRLKVDYQTLEQRYKDADDAAKEVEQKIGEVANDVDELKAQLKDKESNLTPFEETEAYKEKMTEINETEFTLNMNKEKANEQIVKLKENRQELITKRDALREQLDMLDQHERAQERRDELADRERTLASEYEKLEQEVYLADEFIKAKVALLEDKINSKFKMANFKLFETQINEGVKETCETTYNGVPYSKGLNNAARINVGLDIIDTLAEHYQVSAPIFVDNAEAVTKLIDIDAQLISLVVSEQDKELRVETPIKQEAV